MLAPAQVTPADFVKKWTLRFADNNFQFIREATFREFAADIAAVFGVDATNVPAYQPGASYQKGFLVRYTPVGGQEGFYYALKAGTLADPETPGKQEWQVVPGPTKATQLSQSISLAQAQGSQTTRTVVQGRSYRIDYPLSTAGKKQWVYLQGLDGYFSREGTLEVDGEFFGVEHVDVLSATYALKADANPQGADFVSQKNGTTSFQLGPQNTDVNRLRMRRYTSAGLLPTLPALPVPAEAPNIPAPGDPLVLPASGTALAGSPEISEHGETVAAGQSIEVTGEQLAGTKAAIYAGGQLLQASCTADTDQVAAVQLPTNTGAFGAYVLWLENATGYGEPVLLNRTHATWMTTTLAVGITAHVFGLNLVHGDVPGGASYLYLVHKVTGDVYPCQVLPDTVPERVSFTVPAAPVGDYWMHPHNGHGDKWGWSDRLSCTIVSAQDHVKAHEWTTSNALTNTGGDMAHTINTALLSDSRNNRRTVLPAGTWIAEEGIELVSGNYVQGEADARTGFPLTVIKPKPGAFDFSGDRGLMGSPAPKQMLRIENLLLDNSTSEPMGPVNRLMVLRRCTQVLLRNVWLIEPGGALVRLDEDTSGLYIENCYLEGGRDGVGEPIFLLPSPEAQVFVEKTAFVLTWNADSAFNASGVSQIALLKGCTVDNKDSSVLDGAFQGKGRYLKGSGAYGVGSECWHVEGNRGRDLGVMRDWLGTAQNPVLNATLDDNEGEGIMYEGAETRMRLPVVSATRTTIASSSKPTSDKFTGAAPFAHYAHIVRGRGMGQMRRLVANDGNGTITLDKPWRVVPNATSIVMIGTYCRFVHIVDNTFSARVGMNGPNYSASKFIEVYGGCHKWRVKRNGINGFRSGLSTFTTQHNSNDFIDSCSHNDLTDNTIVACRYSVRIEVTGEGGGGLPSGGGYPASGQVALHLRNRVINPVLYHTIIAAARTDDPTTATNFPYPLIAGLLIEGDLPVLPFPNDYRTTSNPTRFPVINVGPNQLAAVVLAVAASTGTVLVSTASDELGPPEFLPPGAIIRADGRLRFAASVQLHLYLLDWQNRLVPLARTLPAPTSSTGTGYTDGQIDNFLLGKADENDRFKNISVIDPALPASAITELLKLLGPGHALELVNGKLGLVKSVAGIKLPPPMGIGAFDMGTGTLNHVYADMYYSDYIAIEPGVAIEFTNGPGSTPNLQFTAVYDANKVFLGSIYDIMVAGGNGAFVAPANAAFMRLASGITKRSFVLNAYSDITYTLGRFPYLRSLNGFFAGPDGNLEILVGNTEVRTSNVVKLDRNSEHAPLSSGTFTVDLTSWTVGAQAVVYLGASCTDPALPAAKFQPISGSYQAGKSLMYTLKAGANGMVQYVITELP